MAFLIDGGCAQQRAASVHYKKAHAKTLFYWRQGFSFLAAMQPC
jgi:hypothetical protein